MHNIYYLGLSGEHRCPLGYLLLFVSLAQSEFIQFSIQKIITKNQLKQCFLRKTMSPQPSSFVGYIENYGIKLWRPFKQQYSMGRNGHRPKWLRVEMIMDRNGYGPK